MNWWIFCSLNCNFFCHKMLKTHVLSETTIKSWFFFKNDWRYFALNCHQSKNTVPMPGEQYPRIIRYLVCDAWCAVTSIFFLFSFSSPSSSSSSSSSSVAILKRQFTITTNLMKTSNKHPTDGSQGCKVYLKITVTVKSSDYPTCINLILSMLSDVNEGLKLYWK